MKQCLQCDKEFESKRDAGKFCSGKCRVKWHRKNPKKEQVQKFQMQVLYNEMVEILSEIKTNLHSPEKINTSALPVINNYTKDEQPMFYKEESQIDAWKKDMQSSDDKYELEMVASLMKEDKDLTRSEKNELERFGLQVYKEKGF